MPHPNCPKNNILDLDTYYYRGELVSISAYLLEEASVQVHVGLLEIQDLHLNKQNNSGYVHSQKAIPALALNTYLEHL